MNIRKANYRHLPLFVRRILGLWAMGYRKPSEIAEAVVSSTEKVELMLRELIACRTRVVQRALNGLIPPDCIVPLPYRVEGEINSVLCFDCNVKVTSVPCLACLLERTEPGSEEGNGDLIGEEDPPLPPRPTQAKPGSAAKITVFRSRIHKGYALTHPHDRKEAT